MSAVPLETHPAGPAGSEVHGVAIVTGACRNVGAAVAIELAAAGASVAVSCLDEASRPEAESVVTQICEGGGAGLAVMADVSDAVAVAAMVELVLAQLGPISVLVNNAEASVASPRPWHEIGTAE